MPAQTLMLMGKKFVLLPKSEYDRMRAKLERQETQDRGDAAEAKRRATQPSIPLLKVRQRLEL